MNAEININTPFLFLVVGEHGKKEKTKLTIPDAHGTNFTKKMTLIHFIGRFTGVEESSDQSKFPP